MYEKLGEAGILADGSQDNDEEKPQDADTKTQRIRFTNKKKKVCEAQIIRLRIIKVEKDREIQLRN